MSYPWIKMENSLSSNYKIGNNLETNISYQRSRSNSLDSSVTSGIKDSLRW